MTATPIEETYHDVEKLICHVCRLFQRRYGGDLDDLIGEANLKYIDAYKNKYPVDNPEDELAHLQRDILHKYEEIHAKMRSNENLDVVNYVDYINAVVKHLKEKYGDLLGNSLSSFLTYLLSMSQDDIQIKN